MALWWKYLLVGFGIFVMIFLIWRRDKKSKEAIGEMKIILADMDLIEEITEYDIIERF